MISTFTNSSVGFISKYDSKEIILLDKMFNTFESDYFLSLFYKQFLFDA